MDSSEWRNKFEHELLAAEEARNIGLEGRARVCARRAVSMIAREYFSHRMTPLTTNNGFALLRLLEADPGVSPNQARILHHFSEQVSPAHELLSGADLIAEARILSDLIDSGSDFPANK